MTRWPIAAITLCAAACILSCKGQNAGTEAANLAASSAPGAAASGSPTSQASSAPSPAPVAAGEKGATTEVWKGSYASNAASLFIPRAGDVPNAKDWESVKFRGDDAGAGRGDGTVLLRVDRATGAVEGELDGVVGPARIYGRIRDGGLVATVARKDAGDNGFTGTASAKIDKEGGKGIMRLADYNATLLREVPFTIQLAP